MSGKPIAVCPACDDRALPAPSPGLTVASVHGRQNDIWSFKRRAAVEPVDWLDTLGLAGGRIS